MTQGYHPALGADLYQAIGYRALHTTPGDRGKVSARLPMTLLDPEHTRTTALSQGMF